MLHIFLYFIDAYRNIRAGVIDLVINDVFMNHVMYNVMKFLQPTHVIVMGDILGSQYISDKEFDSRVRRYRWIFRDALKNEKVCYFTIVGIIGSDQIAQITVVNLVGNHDIGYGSEVSETLVNRFEKAFGPTNAVHWIRPPATATNSTQHLLVVANGQLLDPARDQNLRGETWNHLQKSKQLANEHQGSKKRRKSRNFCPRHFFAENLTLYFICSRNFACRAHPTSQA